MSEDLYSILGVGPDATIDDIRRAYVNLIRRVHPDVNPGHEDEAKALNVAYETLSHPERRRLYDEARFGTVCPLCGDQMRDREAAAAHLFAHMMAASIAAGACERCGRLPTGVFKFRANAGFLLFRQVYGFDGQLCRVCAKGVYREFQSRNLARGWWGLFSFFATPWHLASNAARLSVGRARLDNPQPADPVADSMLAGRPIFRRPSVLLASGILVALTWMTISTSVTDATACDSQVAITLDHATEIHNELVGVVDGLTPDESTLNSLTPITSELSTVLKELRSVREFALTQPGQEIVDSQIKLTDTERQMVNALLEQRWTDAGAYLVTVNGLLPGHEALVESQLSSRLCT